MAARQIAAVVWKEWRETVRLDQGIRSNGFRFLVLAGLAVLLGWRRGATFGRDVSTVFILMELTLLATMPIVTDAFAGEKERHTLETLLASSASERDILLGKFLAILGIGVSFALLACVVEIVIVFARFGGSSLIGMSPGILLSGLLLGAAAGAVMASSGIIFSLHSNSVRAANQILAYTIVALIFIMSSVLRRLPETWLAAVAGWRARTPPVTQVVAATAIMAGISAILLSIGLATLKRALVGKSD